MFKVVKVKYPNQNFIEGYQIVNDTDIYYRVNEFLRRKLQGRNGQGSINTCKQYAYKLCKFLNYLKKEKDKSYIDATEKDVNDFLNTILYKTDEGIFYINDGKVTYNTLVMYLTVIKGFYSYLNRIGINYGIKVSYKYINAKHSQLYSNIHFIEVEDFLESFVKQTSGTKKYIKWYEDEQIEVILSNLNTLRDKAIFLMSLEGMRIDEILSLRIYDYNQNERYAQLYKSKGRETANVNRTVSLPIRTCKILDDYIFNERTPIITSFLLESKNVNLNLFLNLRKDEYQGCELKYRNSLEILKTAAKKARLNPSVIRTHSGRSTRVMELLHHQSEHPEDNITDEIIRQMMGWESPFSIKSYINTRDLRISRASAKKIQKNKDRRDIEHN